MDNIYRNSKKDALIKFVVPVNLKTEAQRLADQRNISLSALLRLVLSEYVRHKR